MAAAPVVPASPASTPAPVPLSQGARIVNTFIAPSKTFTDLRRSASWWTPWILISIFSMLFIYAIGKQVGFEQVSKNQIAHSSRADQFDKLPADQQAKQLQLSSKIIGFFAYGSPLLILFYALIETLALWLTFKLMAGAETTFKTAFAGINPEGFDINNPVGTNLAYYLDPETTGKFVRGMASSLDVINIWMIVLLGMGFACTSKVKRSTAIGIVAAWYLVYKLATSAFGSM